MRNLVMVFIWACSTLTYAQKVAFSGYGRASLMNHRLHGNVLANDSLCPTKGTDGDMVFDIGMHFMPYDFFRAKSIIRLKNQFGLFFGQGSVVELRQLLIEGIVNQKLKYALGDIDLIATPYTLHNPSEINEMYEADVFKLRRDIMHYENFNSGEKWRLQGAKANVTMNVNNTKTDINLQGFATRTRPTNYFSTSDRFLMGLIADANIGKTLRLGANLVSFFDHSSQVDSSRYYSNVLSGSLVYKKNFFTFESEAGMSQAYKSWKPDSGQMVRDLFFDLRSTAHSKPLQTSITLGFKYVGASFISPAAQSLRIRPTSPTRLFTYLDNYNMLRAQLLYDQLTDQTLYNGSIMSVLTPYLPYYGNVQPYGAATPNRVGLYGKAKLGKSDGWLTLNADGYLLRELAADSLSAKRDFLLVNVDMKVNLSKLLKVKRKMVFTLGHKHEITQRTGYNPVTLQSQYMHMGFTLEVLPQFDLLCGYKLLQAKGLEYLVTRGELNSVLSWSAYTVNFTQKTFGAGVRYRFTEKSFFCLTGNWAFLLEKDRPQHNYHINQYFICYVLQF